MDATLTFTGERFIPGVRGEIVYEHVHRYAFAARLAAGRRVLDVACGEGYGSALLARVAREVTGVDLDAATVAHARATYADRANLRFAQGPATKLPAADASVDLVVSFETIEHLDAADQAPMLDEFARVLAPGGLLVLSAPNRVEYSDARGYANPYHRHEHDRAELARLLDRRFPAQAWHAQRVWLGSTIWREPGGAGAEAFDGDAGAVATARPPAPMYFVVVAAKDAAALPDTPAISLFSDAEETELKRGEAQAKELLRLDALVAERDRQIGELDRRSAQIEAHMLERERLVEKRDAELAALNARAGHAEALVAERDGQIERAHAHAGRAEALVAERDVQLERAHAHARHLGELVAFRDKLVVERDAGLASARADNAARAAEHERQTAELARLLADARTRLDDAIADCARLERALEAQDRIIAYRQSFRWWLALPWKRAKLAWSRLAPPPAR